MRTVFSKVSTILPSDARMIMGRLVDAYTACQAEQGRVVDAREYGLADHGCATTMVEVEAST